MAGIDVVARILRVLEHGRSCLACVITRTCIVPEIGTRMCAPFQRAGEKPGRVQERIIHECKYGVRIRQSTGS